MNLATLQIVRPIPEGRKVVVTVLGRAARVARIYLVIAVGGVTLAVSVRMLGVRGLMSGSFGFALAILVSSVVLSYIGRRLPMVSEMFWRMHDPRHSNLIRHESADMAERLRVLERPDLSPEVREGVREWMVRDLPVQAGDRLIEVHKDEAENARQERRNKGTDERKRHITVSLEWMSSALAAIFAFGGAAALAFKFHSALLGGIVSGLWIGAVALVLLLAVECIILLRVPRDSRDLARRFRG